MAAPLGNKNAVGCTTNGRPLKFATVEELQIKIDRYFESCYKEVWVEEKQKNEDGKVIGVEWVPVMDKDGNILKEQVKPHSITGLALALDTSRETLLDYEERVAFSDAIKRAKLRCQNYAEETLFSARNPAGAIFNLKNNYGWKDVTQQDINVTSNYADRLALAEAKSQEIMIDVTPVKDDNS